MSLTHLNVSAYLERINYHGACTATVETLHALHRAHIFTVPCENLDIPLGYAITLDLNHLFDKIVSQKRGGFCYELNGLFAELLRALGFRVELFGAQVLINDQPSLQDAHLTMIVDLDEDWLADVGFGDGFIEPLRLAETREQVQAGHAYHLLQQDKTYTMLERMPDGSSEGYRFERVTHPLEYFREICEWTATSPDSTFTQKRVTTLPTPDGRVTLSNRRLIITRHGEREECELNRTEFESAVIEHFKLRLSPAELDELYSAEQAQVQAGGKSAG